MHTVFFLNNTSLLNVRHCTWEILKLLHVSDGFEHFVWHISEMSSPKWWLAGCFSFIVLHHSGFEIIQTDSVVVEPYIFVWY